MRADYTVHFGRAWVGTIPAEEGCPCRKAPCGLVDGEASGDCDQHGMSHARTMRQTHYATSCPGPTWHPTGEIRIETGPVVISQTKTDPGDTGEPRVFTSEGVTYVTVPDFSLWPSDVQESAGGTIGLRKTGTP